MDTDLARNVYGVAWGPGCPPPVPLPPTSLPPGMALLEVAGSAEGMLGAFLHCGLEALWLPPPLVPVIGGLLSTAAAPGRPAVLRKGNRGPLLEVAPDCDNWLNSLPVGPRAGPVPGRGRTVVLVGPMASGKSTVGRLLAARLGLPFVDSDAEVERRAGKSIRAIFESEGESAFRDLESRVLLELVGRGVAGGGAVLATGGGAVLRPENRALFRRRAWVSWLHADPAELARRAGLGGAANARPLLDGPDAAARLEGIYKERMGLYAAVSELLVATGGLEAPRIAEVIHDAQLSGI